MTSIFKNVAQGMTLKDILEAARIGKFVNKAKWYGERDFYSFLKAGHGIISIQDVDSETRYHLHQEWNLEMQKMRAELLGVKIVHGFFEKGNCCETSQFSNEIQTSPVLRQLESAEYPLINRPGRLPFGNGKDYPEYYLPINMFRRINPDYVELGENIVIGWGCEDIQVTIKTQLDLNQEKVYFQDDVDSTATYDPETKIFKRMSHSKRHCYILKIDAEGICVPLPIKKIKEDEWNKLISSHQDYCSCDEDSYKSSVNALKAIEKIIGIEIPVDPEEMEEMLEHLENISIFVKTDGDEIFFSERITAGDILATLPILEIKTAESLAFTLNISARLAKKKLDRLNKFRLVSKESIQTGPDEFELQWTIT